MVILVVGMHRSGTSLAAGLLHGMGAFTGNPEELLGADEHNPDGYWERVDVLHLHERMLAACGASWDNVAPFDPRRLPRAEIDWFDAESARILARLSSCENSAIKDPRLCLTLPLWRRTLPNPACVFIHRHPAAVAASLQKRNGFSLAFGAELWERYNLAALGALQGLPCVPVSYESLLADPEHASERLYRALVAAGCKGLSQLPREAALSFVKPRAPRAPDHIALTPDQAALCETLNRASRPAGC